MARGVQLIDHCKKCKQPFEEVGRYIHYCEKRKTMRRYNTCIKCWRMKTNIKNAEKMERFNALKRQKIESRGGKCVICGFDDLSCMAVFDFHHTIPAQKTFGSTGFFATRAFSSKNIELW